MHDVSNSNFVPGHTMSAQNLLLLVNSDGWSLSGEANYDTLPIKLAINEKFAEKNIRANVIFPLNLMMLLKKRWVWIGLCCKSLIFQAMLWLMRI